MKFLQLLPLLLLVACNGGLLGNIPPNTTDLPNKSCSISRIGTSTTINCPDGTSASISDGQNGASGTPGLTGGMGLTGQSGLSTVMTTVNATPVQCPNGGIVLMMALDSNNNGIYDVSDTNQTSATVCNGQNGLNGQAGTNGTNGANGGTVTFNLVQVIEPCGYNSSPWKEVLLGLQGGQLLSSYSENVSGQNTRFVFIPDGSYIDTDSSGCNFTVTGDGSTTSQISWGAGSNAYSTWIAGGYSWTPATGWVALP